MNTERINDPSPNHCGICFEPYISDSPTVAAAKSRRASQTCRHAICLECAIQHAFASNQTNCPFCRASKAYSPTEFRTLLEEVETTDTATGAVVVTPHVRELLDAANTKHEQEQAERQAQWMTLMRAATMLSSSVNEVQLNPTRMNNAARDMLRVLLGEEEFAAIPQHANIQVYTHTVRDGIPHSTSMVLTPIDIESAAEDEANE